MDTIYKKLAAVRREIEYIQKDKRVGEGGYMAVTHDMVTAQVRGALIKAGVLIVPSVCGVPGVVLTGTHTAKEVPYIRFEALYNVRFVSEDDGSHVEMTVAAHALDHGDKAPGKALSYATKYAILKMFNIETGEDEEGRDVQHVIGMPEDVFSGWMTQIERVKPGDDVKKLWGQILDDCKKYDDTVAATRLKAALTEKGKASARNAVQ